MPLRLFNRKRKTASLPATGGPLDARVSATREWRARRIRGETTILQHREDPYDEPRSAERRANTRCRREGHPRCDETISTLTRRFDALGIRHWRHGMAGTRTWLPASTLFTSGPAPMGRRVSGNIQMKRRVHRQALMTRRPAATIDLQALRRRCAVRRYGIQRRK